MTLPINHFSIERPPSERGWCVREQPSNRIVWFDEYNGCIRKLAELMAPMRSLED